MLDATSAAGRGPISAGLLSTSSVCKESARPPNADGIGPMKALDCSAREVKRVRRPNSVGSDPDK